MHVQSTAQYLRPTYIYIHIYTCTRTLGILYRKAICINNLHADLLILQGNRDTYMYKLQSYIHVPGIGTRYNTVFFLLSLTSASTFFNTTLFFYQLDTVY